MENPLCKCKGGVLFFMRIQDARFVVLDTETTGLDAEVDKVVDISLVEVSRNGIQPLYNTLIHPGRDIPPTASAIHHITLKDVADKPKFEDIWPTVLSYVEDAIIVAHNAPFDRSMLPKISQPWICSYRLARHLWPDAPAHGNQVLRYWLGIDIDAGMAHSAMADTLITAHVFWRELAYYRKHLATTDQIEELLKYVEAPIKLMTMPFGKHRGKSLRELPSDYVEWALRNLNDMDEDLRWSLEQLRKQQTVTN